MTPEFKSFMTRVKELDTNPTVRVAIDGLAILCFSKKNGGRAEAGFLPVCDHPLSLTIYDKNGKPVCNTPIDINSGSTIKINHKNPGIGTLYIPDDGPLPNELDDKDFRHLLSIDAIHNHLFRPPQRLLLKPNLYFAKLYLSNGAFFTYKRSQNNGKIICDDRGDSSINLGVSKVGRVIGANIYNDEVLVEVNSLPTPITLKRDADAPYCIVIRYKCERTDGPKTDFERFYDVLELPTGHKKLDLQFDGDERPEPLDCEKKFAEQLKTEGFDKDSEKGRILSQLFKNMFFAEEACQGATVPECPTNLQGEPEDCP